MDKAVKTVTRTVTISDMTPAEMASIFANWNDDQQAAFFDAVAAEAENWPFGGWWLQGYNAGSRVTPAGRQVIEALAGGAADV